MAWWIFQNIIVTAVLAALVWIGCRVGRIGPVGRHALWAIVLVKFVTPPVVVWPWVAPDPLGVAALDARAARSPAAGPTSIGANRSPRELSAAVAGPGDDVSRGAIDGGASKPTSIAPWLFGVWTTGSLVLLGIEGVRLGRLGRRLRAGRPADANIVDRVTALSARLGLEPVPVLEVDGLSAPLVWCVGRPKLLWPAGLAVEASDACVDGLLLHELAHVRRRDHFIGWIELVAGVVWCGTRSTGPCDLSGAMRRAGVRRVGHRRPASRPSRAWNRRTALSIAPSHRRQSSASAPAPAARSKGDS
jgi:beta-lactamase regulating signal transducer with metallopeptidase domain